MTQQADGTYTYTQPEGLVSISAVIGSASGDAPIVTLSGGRLTVINPAAAADDVVDMILIVAGYTGGKMSGCQVIDRVTDVTEAELTVTGDSIRVFFLDPGTYAPLFAYADAAQSN